MPVTAAGFGGNYVKTCKSAGCFTCLNTSLIPGGTCILRRDTYFGVGSREVARKKKSAYFQFVIWLKGSAFLSRL